MFKMRYIGAARMTMIIFDSMSNFVLCLKMTVIFGPSLRLKAPQVYYGQQSQPQSTEIGTV